MGNSDDFASFCFCFGELSNLDMDQRRENVNFTSIVSGKKIKEW